MKVELVRADPLPAALKQRWAELQRGDASLSSPYFCPDYCEAVAATRAGVRVGVLEQGGCATAFFPFELRRFGLAVPVGGRLSDYHGVVAHPELVFDAPSLLRACGLRAWRFDHLPVDQVPFRPFHERLASSPVMDLDGGFDDYLLRRRQSGHRIDQLLRKGRKLAREQPDVRFEFHSNDAGALEQAIEWKRQQCRRTGVPDFLGLRENSDLLRRIHALQGADFAGVLSVLRAGDRIAAVHFGMRSHRVLHWWFPGYEAQLGHYSPGGVLLLEVARAAASLGLSRVDLGKGDDSYKRSFATSSVPLAEGAATSSRWFGSLRRLGCESRAWLRNSRVLAPLRAASRRLRRLLGQDLRSDATPH